MFLVSLATWRRAARLRALCDVLSRFFQFFLLDFGQHLLEERHLVQLQVVPVKADDVIVGIF